MAGDYFTQGDMAEQYVYDLESYYDSLFDEDGLPVEDDENPFYFDIEDFMDTDIDDLISGEGGDDEEFDLEYDESEEE